MSPPINGLKSDPLAVLSGCKGLKTKWKKDLAVLLLFVLWSGPPEKYGVRADSIIAKPGIPNGQNGGFGLQFHMEVVTFDPGQAYPEFIVKFREL